MLEAGVGWGGEENGIQLVAPFKEQKPLTHSNILTHTHIDNAKLPNRAKESERVFPGFVSVAVFWVWLSYISTCWMPSSPGRSTKHSLDCEFTHLICVGLSLPTDALNNNVAVNLYRYIYIVFSLLLICYRSTNSNNCSSAKYWRSLWWAYTFSAEGKNGLDWVCLTHVSFKHLPYLSMQQRSNNQCRFSCFEGHGSAFDWSMNRK